MIEDMGDGELRMATLRRSRLLRTIPLLIAVCFAGFDAKAQYGGGTGEPNDPYLVYTAEQMNTIGADPNDWDKNFVLTSDIDMSSVIDYRPVGLFTGSFDGQGYIVQNLTIDANATGGNYHLGLFGKAGLGSQVANLGMVNVTVIGGDSSRYVGGLCGSNEGAIFNCYTSGTVSGAQMLGGLCGWNESSGTISNCYATGSVTSGSLGNYIGGLCGGNSDGGTISNCNATVDVSSGVGYSSTFGGLCGLNQRYGTISNCYATGSVLGDQNLGGLCGGNGGGTISNCYATGSVSGNQDLGGLCGENGGTISSCYSTGSVWGTQDRLGGLCGENRGDITASFWDIETSGQTTSNGGTGKTTAEMQGPNTFIEAGWDFVGQTDEPHDFWAEPVGGGYPILSWQLPPLFGLPGFSGGTGEPNDPYLISTADELNSLGHNPRLMTAHFKLVNDIDLAGVDLFIIGNELFPFTGVFDGNGKNVYNFTHTSTDTSYVGLFSYVEGENAEIRSLGLINPNIDAGTGDVLYIGSLAGCLEAGTITNCYVAGGSVSGSFSVGGLVGSSSRAGVIANCYSTSSVSGNLSVGGLVGSSISEQVGSLSWPGGIIANCYSTGSVSGNLSVGGLVGSAGTEDVIHSFWDTQTSDQATSRGGTGLTTAEMQMQNTFTDAGWDFTTPVWTIDEGTDYPRLWWDAETGQEIRTFTLLGHTGGVRSVAFSPDGTRVLTGSEDFTAKLWDAETGQEIRTFIGHTDRILSVAFSPDGTRFLTGSYDSTAKLWKAETGRGQAEIRTFRGHTSRVRSVAFSPDGTRVLTGSDDETAKLWDSETGREIRTLRGNTGQILSVAFSHDGTRILTGSWDSTAKLWDAETGREIHTLRGHTGRVFSVAFSPDGTQVLTGGRDVTAKLWDAKTGREIRTFLGHTGFIRSVAFSPDGTRVLTGSDDSTAKLWDAETGQESRTFDGHTDRVFSAAFSPDGTRVLTGSRDGTAWLWDAENWLQPQPPGVPPAPPQPPGPPPKGRACFLADTPVWVNGALVQISNVVSGQMVGELHCDLPTDCLEQIETVEQHEGAFECRDIVLESETRISVVDAHCFMLDSGQWIAAQNLRSGLRLKTLSGTVSIKSVATRAVPFVGKVYNLKIENSDKYGGIKGVRYFFRLCAIVSNKNGAMLWPEDRC
jgi:WD40 repeat protein